MLTFILTQARKYQRKYQRVTSCYTFDKLRDDKWIPADTCNNNICSLVANIARVTVSYTNVAVSFTDFRFDISMEANVGRRERFQMLYQTKVLCLCILPFPCFSKKLFILSLLLDHLSISVYF